MRRRWDSFSSDSSRGAARSRALQVAPITTTDSKTPFHGVLEYVMRRRWDSNPQAAYAAQVSNLLVYHSHHSSLILFTIAYIFLNVSSCENQKFSHICSYQQRYQGERLFLEQNEDSDRYFSKC